MKKEAAINFPLVPLDPKIKPSSSQGDKDNLIKTDIRLQFQYISLKLSLLIMKILFIRKQTLSSFSVKLLLGNITTVVSRTDPENLPNLRVMIKYRVSQ